MSGVGTASLSPLFDTFRKSLEESAGVRERLKEIVSEIEGVTRQMHAALLPVHLGKEEAARTAVAKARDYVPQLQELYAKLAGIIKERPGQYYRYHDHWRNVSQTAAFLLCFMHWLETGQLLSHGEVQEHLSLNPEEFALDLEDYLIGVCNVSNEMPRFVVNRVTAGDYDCPQRVAQFLSELYAAFRLLNLRNDFLRKRFDGLKYDLKRVEEVLYDVRIRKLGSSTAAASQGQASPPEHQADK